MGGDDQGEFLGFHQFQQEFLHLGRRLLVKVSCGFICQNTIGIGYKRPGDCGALAFASGQFRRLVLEAMREPDSLQDQGCLFR